jgi:uncharacterized protein
VAAVAAREFFRLRWTFEPDGAGPFSLTASAAASRLGINPEDRAMDRATQTEIEAAAFRQLVAHLREHTEAQNIDLMNLAGFCRNCLAKWYRAAAQERGVAMDYEAAREHVYGMPYAEWKSRYQT